jgi:hypothetical protein
LSARGGIGGDEQGRNAKYLMPSNAVSTIPKPQDETYNKEQNRPRKTTRQYVILRGVPRQPDLGGEERGPKMAQFPISGTLRRECIASGMPSCWQALTRTGECQVGQSSGIPVRKKKDDTGSADAIRAFVIEQSWEGVQRSKRKEPGMPLKMWRDRLF